MKITEDREASKLFCSLNIIRKYETDGYMTPGGKSEMYTKF